MGTARVVACVGAWVGAWHVAWVHGVMIKYMNLIDLKVKFLPHLKPAISKAITARAF